MTEDSTKYANVDDPGSGDTTLTVTPSENVEDESKTKTVPIGCKSVFAIHTECRTCQKKKQGSVLKATDDAPPMQVVIFSLPEPVSLIASFDHEGTSYYMPFECEDLMCLSTKLRMMVGEYWIASKQAQFNKEVEHMRFRQAYEVKGRRANRRNKARAKKRVQLPTES